MVATTREISIPTQDELKDNKLIAKENLKNEKQIQMIMRCIGYFNSAFPIFIPLAHHQISIFDIVNRSPRGKYWAYVIHYLISTTGHGSHTWRTFQKQIRNEKFSCHPYISAKTVSKLLPDGLPAADCREESEYLVEPYLLVQLPHQTDLFHHWLVHILLEVLDFEVILNNFYHHPFPLKFKNDVKMLDNCLTKIQEFILKGFRLLQEKVDQDESSEEADISFVPVMEFVKFWIYSHGSNIIDSLLYYCYAETKTGKKKTMEKKTNFINQLGIYSLSSWLNAAKERKMFTSHTKTLDCGESLSNQLMDAIMKGKSGMINTIILRSDATIGQLVSPEYEVYFQEKPDEITRVLRKLSRNNDWSIDEEWKEIKQDIARDEFELKYTKKTTLKAIAKGYEIRIKKMLLTTKNSKHKDVHFQLYMLPCFVAAFIEMNHSGNLTSKENDWYMKFLDKLISTYEESPDSAEVTKNSSLLMQTKHSSRSSLLLSYFRGVTSDLLSSVIDNTSRQFLRFDLLSAFYEALEYGNTQQFPQYSPNEEISTCVNDYYISQIFCFFTKIEVALHYALPPKPSLLKTSSNCLWAPNMGDLIRTLCLYGMSEKENTLLYIPFKSYSKLLYDVLKCCKALHDDAAVKKEISGLTLEQKLSLAFYLTIKFVSRDRMLKSLNTTKFDLADLKLTFGTLGKAFHSYLQQGRMWLLKDFYSVKLGFKTAVSLEFAKTSAPICFDIAIKDISNAGKLLSHTLNEKWCYPIKHCSFCGSVHNPDKLKMCEECSMHPDYPDKNFFCSVDCAITGLNAYHRDQHSEFRRFISGKKPK